MINSNSTNKKQLGAEAPSDSVCLTSKMSHDCRWRGPCPSEARNSTERDSGRHWLHRLVRLSSFSVRRFDMSGNPLCNQVEVRQIEECIQLPWLNLLFVQQAQIRSPDQVTGCSDYSVPRYIYGTKFYLLLSDLGEKLREIYPAEFRILCDLPTERQLSNLWQPVSPDLLAHVLRQIQCSDLHTLAEWKNHPMGLCRAILESSPFPKRHTIVGSAAYATGEFCAGEEAWVNVIVSWGAEAGSDSFCLTSEVSHD